MWLERNKHRSIIQAKWACEVPTSQMKSKVNHNQHITDKLEVCQWYLKSCLLIRVFYCSIIAKDLLSTYKTSSLPKDRWRAMALTKAITAIKKHPKEITTYEVLVVKLTYSWDVLSFGVTSPHKRWTVHSFGPNPHAASYSSTLE